MIAIAIASSSGLIRTSSSEEMTTSSPRLATREARFSGGAPIESSGRPPIWFSDWAPSSSSKSRGTTSTATRWSRQARMQLSSCWWLAREKAMITRSTSRSSRTWSSWSSEPSLGRRWAPSRRVDVVVDEADRLEPELGVAFEPVGEPVGDDPGADDHGALAQRRHAVGPAAGERAGDAVEAGGGEGRDQRDQRRPGEPERRRRCRTPARRGAARRRAPAARRRGRWPRSADRRRCRGRRRRRGQVEPAISTAVRAAAEEKGTEKISAVIAPARQAEITSALSSSRCRKAERLLARDADRVAGSMDRSDATEDS